MTDLVTRAREHARMSGESERAGYALRRFERDVLQANRDFLASVGKTRCRDCGNRGPDLQSFPNRDDPLRCRRCRRKLADHVAEHV